MTALLGLSKGRYRIVSSEQMKKRPMKELLQSLESLGAKIEYEEEEYHFPFVIGHEGDYKDNVSVDVEKSSQFLSALLISSIVVDKDFKINVIGSHGMAYVEMTIQMMKQFGVDVLKSGSTYTIFKNSHYNGKEYSIEPDMSAACYFYAMSPLLKVKSKVVGVNKKSLQGDIAFLDVLSDMGCDIVEKDDGIECIPPRDGVVKSGEWDLSSFSDQTLTLAAIAPFCDGKVVIRGVSHIRLQECDRINAIITNLDAMGVKVTEKNGVISIWPANISEMKPCQVQTFEDHRVSMSFSLPGLLFDGIEIINPYCCRKTFENYFEVLEKSVY